MSGDFFTDFGFKRRMVCLPWPVDNLPEGTHTALLICLSTWALAASFPKHFPRRLPSTARDAKRAKADWRACHCHELLGVQLRQFKAKSPLLPLGGRCKSGRPSVSQMLC